MTKYKSIIGRAETIDLPGHLLYDIPAKIDTGAFQSSIHATDIREYKKKNGKKVLKFKLLGNHPAYPYDRDIEVENYSLTKVENSFGQSEERYKVTFKVKLAGKVFNSTFTLADRSIKTFPILLGRTCLNRRFIIDTSIVHVDRSILKTKLKEWLAKDDLSDDEDNS